MSATNQTIQEDLNATSFQRLANILSRIKFGDLLVLLINSLASKTQVALLTQTGASQAVTFLGLGMIPPASTNYAVIIEGELTNRCVVDESTKTTSGFTILNGTNAEIANIIVTEGPALVTVSSSLATLSAAPAEVIDVYATAGTTTGRKALKVGGSDVLPATGEVVWDGKTKLRFNAADAVTKARIVTLPTTAQTLSLFGRSLEQRNG